MPDMRLTVRRWRPVVKSIRLAVFPVSSSGLLKPSRTYFTSIPFRFTEICPAIHSPRSDIYTRPNTSKKGFRPVTGRKPMPTQPPLTHTVIRVPCNGGKPSRPTPLSARNSKVIFHLPYSRRDSTLPGSLCLSDRCTVFLIVFFKSSAIINLSMRKVKVFSYILFSIRNSSACGFTVTHSHGLCSKCKVLG